VTAKPALPTLATVWLDGCSGCHMSVLDLDERLLELLTDRAELVYSPLVDRKDYPDEVDVCLVEGAVSTTDDLRRIREVRARTRILVALGDCAVTANVPGMRNPIGPRPLLVRAYDENVTGDGGPPTREVPELLPTSTPVHRVVHVDVFMPGCPPSADRIHHVLDELLAGRLPGPEHARFGG
jgi:NAD-reducing hydrogenase small subunit